MVNTLQQRWRARSPGLAAELLRRPGDSDGLVTLMEVYDVADPASAAELEAEAAAATATWRQGARHVEPFVLLP